MIISPYADPTPDQAKVIDSPLTTPHVVNGPAGTGKTYTAIKRIEALLNDDSNQIIFFTAYNHMTLLYAKRHLEQLRIGASLVDIGFSGDLYTELVKAIKTKRKKVVFFLTNMVLSNFIATVPSGGNLTPINALKSLVDRDASFSTLTGSYKLHLLLDEAQVVSKVFLDELFEAFIPSPASNDSRVFLDFKMNLFLDLNQALEDTGAYIYKVDKHFTPPVRNVGEIESVFANHQPGYEVTKLVENVRNPEEVNLLLSRYLRRHRQDEMRSLPMVPVSSDEPALLVWDDSRTQSKEDAYKQLVTSVVTLTESSQQDSFGVIFVSNSAQSDAGGQQEKRVLADLLNEAMRTNGLPQRAVAYEFGDGWEIRSKPSFDISTAVWVMDTLSIRGVEFSHVIIPYVEVNSQFERRMYMSQSRTRGLLWVFAKKSTVDKFSSDDPKASEAKIYADLYEVEDI